MLIFAIDDEPIMLKLLHEAIQQAAPTAEIRDFALGMLAIQALENEETRPDVVFSDIKMPEMDGLMLAVKIKERSPGTKIVFVTSHSEYAVDAYQLHASGYIMKPVEASRVREELEQFVPASHLVSEKLQVRCFGYFDVFWHNEPLMFSRRKTKELFAFLIDREGKTCTSEEISAALWENETGFHDTKARIRQLISDMRNTLHTINMEDILIRRSGQLAIRREMVDCDYYRMLDGDMEMMNSYRGKYMAQYSWAEVTMGSLYFREQEKKARNHARSQRAQGAPGS